MYASSEYTNIIGISQNLKCTIFIQFVFKYFLQSVEKVQTSFKCNKHNGYLTSIRYVYKIKWINKVGPDRLQMTIMRRIRCACWVTKARDTLRIISTSYFTTAQKVRRTQLMFYLINTLLV